MAESLPTEIKSPTTESAEIALVTTDSGETKSPTTDMAEPLNDIEMQGFLFKWVNFIKGYKKRWFLLSGGYLYHYKYPPNGKNRR